MVSGAASLVVSRVPPTAAGVTDASGARRVPCVTSSSSVVAGVPATTVTSTTADRLSAASETATFAAPSLPAPAGLTG